MAKLESSIGDPAPSPERDEQLSMSVDTPTAEEISAAAHRVIGEDTALEQPDPPAPHETDDQIRARHREFQEEKVRRLQKETPPGVDSELNREMLRRFAEGDFTTPPDVK